MLFLKTAKHVIKNDKKKGDLFGGDLILRCKKREGFIQGGFQFVPGGGGLIRSTFLQ